MSEVGEIKKEAGEKNKKVKAPTPTASAVITAGNYVVRCAFGQVFGLLPSSTAVSIQPTWVTDAGTAKLTMSLDGSRRHPFPKESEEHDALINIASELCEKMASEITLEILVVARNVVQSVFVKEGLPAIDPAIKVDEIRFVRVGAGLVMLDNDEKISAKATGLVIEGRVASKKKADTGVLLAGKKRQVSAKFRVASEENDIFAAESHIDEEEFTKVIQLYTHEYLRAKLIDLQKAQRVVEEEKKNKNEIHKNDDEMIVDPFNVSGKIDYEKLIREFGSERIDETLLQRLSRLVSTPRLHRFLRRGIFFSHRDLHKICECMEQGIPFYLYTGRGPSSSAMHLGHLVPFMMTQWLQEALGVPLVVQMTDDEKFLWKGEYNTSSGDYNLDHYRTLTRENAKDIIACGFDPKRTFIFSDCEYIQHMYPNILKIWKSITYNQARGAFGFTGQSNIGQSAFPAIQAAPSFATSFLIPLSRLFENEKRKNTQYQHLALAPCLIPCAIDQDPYFRLTRDIAKKMCPATHRLEGKPALLHSKFFPPLQGSHGKMSSSDDNSAIFLTDTPDDIERKIMTLAFSGGRETAKLQREYGADLDADVSYQWLTFFLDDDEELAKIQTEYGSGQGDFWNTSAVKAKLVTVLKDLVRNHQIKREAITDADLDAFFAVRPLDPPSSI
uniref:tryptophan--tRNA ligase n=1 Tax=Aureoumbra lagunensis TaxID=44058 RepID=A0A7S3K5D9_9STRA|mmetsp:Transcript_8935/g.11267  ORF Transcript_8935/g.11267 Transcript_8935/m.11267 type:complete len:671 (+) Transcript_8935:52-2064(+)|eukprot:CAMPEP_0197291164 /NCGR_PEP_ID=MMETSP0890-20130614/11716_1 /TAXON_ID=44058 ORGANISM="Aureoumbra lagunensis, Strain CCMP1510" /NCGR_SAMPLE_ID=MMETSP0890 /ASSEMBLY_ACC=CAM_ASM_000533 /LENGTH=670 /DNA_ID=CAMNT_0042763789 /DNA_START=26 /DNA_END=2038 /DNA_ORIENTATION=-